MTVLTTERQSDFAAVSGMYELLSRLWLHEVDDEFVNELGGSDLRAAFEAAGGFVPDEADIEQLRTEYCRLFVGPRDHLPPLQSVWMRGELQSEITTSIEMFASAVRYESQETMHDHLGVLLGIMSRATELNSESTCEDSLDFAREFFRRHLTWTNELLAAAEGRAEHSFYESLAIMTREFLREEGEIWLDRSATSDKGSS